MRILADAHIGWLIVRHLESLGHDVLRAATLPPSTSDAEVLKRAVGEGRVILTSDKDFGELVSAWLACGGRGVAANRRCD